MIPFYIGIFLTAFLVSILCTWGMRALAKKIKFLDYPNPRKMQKAPVPLLGGVALWMCFFGMVWGLLLAAKCLGKGPCFTHVFPPEILSHLAGAFRQIPKLALITFGAIAIASVGLFDDRYHITPRTKFLFQLLVAFATALGGMELHLFIEHPLLTLLLSTLWLVTLMNSLNLLDNMDGLSAGVTLIASLIFASIAVSTHQYFLAVALLTLAGACLGFLCFNFHPASIFMGDCGSLMLGYLLGVFTILETFYTPQFPTHFPVFMPLLILAVPLYDTASVICVRLYHRESIFKADKRHFSHRLNALGMNVRGTVLFIYFISFALGLGAPLLPQLNGVGAALLFLQTFFLLAIVAVLEFYGERKLGK